MAETASVKVAVRAPQIVAHEGWSLVARIVENALAEPDDLAEVAIGDRRIRRRYKRGDGPFSLGPCRAITGRANGLNSGTPSG